MDQSWVIGSRLTLRRKISCQVVFFCKLQPSNLLPATTVHLQLSTQEFGLVGHDVLSFLVTVRIMDYASFVLGQGTCSAV